MRRLLVMRHAKSDWSADYAADHDRPLNDRGERSARVVGVALAKDGLAPDHVITSSALRARRTAELAAQAGTWAGDVVIEPRLYGSGVDETLDVAGKAPPLDSVMLVGHQPTWSILVSTLTGDRVEMKTGTVAVIGFDIDDWSRLAATTGEIEEVYQPRDLLDSLDPG